MNLTETCNVARRVSLMEQELLTLPKHMSSPPDLSGVRVAQSLFFCVMCSWSLFVPLSFFFLLAIVLSVLHCIVCTSIVVYLLAIALSVLLLLFIFWPLYCLYFYSRLSFGPCIVCTSIVFYLLAIVLSVLLLSFIFWPLYCLYFYCCLSFGHCIVCTSLYCLYFYCRLSLGHCIVCTSLYYLYFIVLSVLLLLFIF